MPYGRTGAVGRPWSRMVSIPHMGCMPYGRMSDSYHVIKLMEFQSLIWVACPTGLSFLSLERNGIGNVSIPHMGCMPYGLYSICTLFVHVLVSIPHMGCMPYGLKEAYRKADRLAVSIPHMGCMPYGPLAGLPQQSVRCVSIPHMGCMPYGLGGSRCRLGVALPFQSLIWVACPTGFSSLYDGEDIPYVSIPHMGCMPYGLLTLMDQTYRMSCFNPSYGLHALRAERLKGGRWGAPARFQSLIWVACPTGARGGESYRDINVFQSLIWVACPTGKMSLFSNMTWI